MTSVADDLRRDSRAGMARRTPAERIALAFQLGDEALAPFRARHGLTESQALAVVRRSRTVGRAPSRSHDPEPA